VIWEPALEVVHSTPTAQGKNELSVKAQGAIYTNNPIFNHADYRIQDRFSLDRATSVLVRYRYVPNLFLGPNFERRTGTRSIQEERVSSHHWRAEIERRLTDSVTGTLITRTGSGGTTTHLRNGIRSFGRSARASTTVRWTGSP
jgi:hypothetical protein